MVIGGHVPTGTKTTGGGGEATVWQSSDMACLPGGQYSDHRHIQDHRDRGKEEVKGQFANVARPDG